MTDTKFVRIFMTQLEQFANELCQLYPDEDSFTRFRIAVDLMKPTPRQAVGLFKEYVVQPYGEELLKRQDGFLETIKAGSGLSWDIFPRLKVYWSEVSPQTREAIWDYCVLLIQISQRIETS